MVVMVFICFAAAGGSLAGQDPGSLPDLLFCTKCGGCDRVSIGWEVRCSNGKFLPAGAIWSTKAPTAHAAGAGGPRE